MDKIQDTRGFPHYLEPTGDSWDQPLKTMTISLSEPTFLLSTHFERAQTSATFTGIPFHPFSFSSLLIQFSTLIYYTILSIVYYKQIIAYLVQTKLWQTKPQVEKLTVITTYINRFNRARLNTNIWLVYISSR